MKHPLLVSLALAAGLIAPVAAQTPAAPPMPAVTAAPARPINHVGGRITAVNGSAVTVEGRRNAPPITFTLAPNAKIHLVTPLQVTDLATGSFVRVDGQVSDDGKSVDARHIGLLSALPPAPAKPGKHHQHITGTIATTMPSLTLTAQDGSAVTVNTTPKTRVDKAADGTASDVAAGLHADARVSGPDTALVATEVNLSPERARKPRK